MHTRKITSILGNEMTYVELEAQAVDFNDLREKGGGKQARSTDKKCQWRKKGYGRAEGRKGIGR